MCGYGGLCSLGGYMAFFGGSGCSGKYRYGRSTLTLVDVGRMVRSVYCISSVSFKR